MLLIGGAIGNWRALRNVFGILLLTHLVPVSGRSFTGQEPPVELHVKFASGADTKDPLALLPPELADSVLKIAPLFTLSEDKLSRLGAARLKLWYRVTLEPGTDVTRFMKALEGLDVVETVERAPEEKPPPEPKETEALLVEFRSGVNAREPLSLLPSELARSVLAFEPVSERRYRIDLKPGTDAEDFLEAILRLESVVSAELVPRGKPPPP